MNRSFQGPAEVAHDRDAAAATGAGSAPGQSIPCVPRLARGLVWSDLVAEMNREHEMNEQHGRREAA